MNRRSSPMFRLSLLGLVTLLSGCGGGGPATAAFDVPGGPVEGLVAPDALAGTRVKAVWVRATGDGTDWGAMGEGIVLMGYDSADGLGERVLHEGFGNYRKPILSPDGRYVAFSHASGEAIHLLDWDTGEVRSLGPGTAVEFFRDPADGRLWVYYLGGVESYRGDLRDVGRFPLDEPGARERVYEGPVSANNFQVAPDGSVAVSLFPWPDAGILDLESGEWERFGRGCWVSLAPDGSGKVWVFDGSHKWVNLRQPDADPRQVVVNGIPGLGASSVYYPRWTNHPRFLVLSAPFERPDNSAADVYLGRFNADHTAVEGWARLSFGEEGDFFPDAWIDAEGPTKAGGSVRASALAGSGQGDFEPVRVEGVLIEKSAPPDPSAMGAYSDALAVYRYRVPSHPETGEPGEVLVAHWVVRDRARIRGFDRSPGVAYELALVPYTGNPAYEGNLLAADMDLGDLRIYVDQAAP